MMNTVALKYHLTVLASVIICSCSPTHNNEKDEPRGENVEFKYAQLLKMVKHDGYIIASIKNPWDTLKSLQTYVLVEDKARRPGGFQDAVFIDIPIYKSVVFSSVHNSLLYELGVPKSICGVCDAEYITEPELKERIKNGEVADCGSNTSPVLEKIIMTSPDAILLSPYENAGHGLLSHTGIPIVECADYMEKSPLARAEWMKFYGLLYGKTNEADSIFRKTENEYNSWKEAGQSASTHPVVLTDRIYGHAWDVPTKVSTMGQLIEDAGGINPFAETGSAGSKALAPEKVYSMASEADIWLIRYAAPGFSKKILASENDIYRGFKPYATGNIYGADSMATDIFDEQAFHPQWILQDMIRIFHPELSLNYGKRYYFPLK